MRGLLVLGLMLTFVPAARAAGTNVTLDEALHAAEERHPSVRGAKMTASAAERTQAAAQALRLPQLGLSGGYLKTSTYRGAPDFIANSAPDEYRAQLTLAYNLWDGGSTAATVDKAHAELAASQAEALNAVHQLRWQVISQYVGLLKAQEALRINQLGLSASEAHLREGRLLLQHGAISELDATRIQLDQASAQLEVERARADVGMAQAQLASTTGLAGDLAVAPPSKRETPQGTVEALVSRARDVRPELEAARARVRAARAEAHAARAAMRPVFQLVGAAGWDTDQFYGPRNAGWDAGLTMSLPVFDGGRLSAQGAAAELNARRAEQDLLAAERTANLEVLQAYQDRAITVRQVSLADAQVRLADKAANMAAVGYRMGSVSTLELTLARQQLVSARLKQSSVQLDAFLATERLRWSTGESLP